MKNKKGFTLIEVLSVIVILSVIMTIAASSVMNLTKKSKENLYCTKLTMIESLAKSYALKYEKELNNSTSYYEGHKSLTIKVEDLISSGLLDPDKNNNVLNPLNDGYLNNEKIIIYLNNNRINAYINSNNIC